jgi:four helix bundle protein
MNAEDFKKRTKAFAIRIVRFAGSVPRTMAGDVICRQLLRAGTSVAANYHLACCAKSRADLVAKMGIVQEECDESLYWLELLIETKQVKNFLVEGLRREAKEILALV